MDEWSKKYQYVLYQATGRHVTYSAPLRCFIEMSRTISRRPVLFTSDDASVSMHLAGALARAGGVWAITTDDHRYDAASGYSISHVSQLWENQPTSTQRHPAYVDGTPSKSAAVLVFDAFVRSSASHATDVGRVAQHMVSGLGGLSIDRWGLDEPLEKQWDSQRLTMAARAGMPASERFLFAAPNGAWGGLAVSRTRTGLLEHVRGGVPALAPGVAGGSPASLVEAAYPRLVSTLESLATDFHAYLATVSLTKVDNLGIGHGLRAGVRKTDEPVAVVLGARAVHELRIDVGLMVERHDVRFVGPGRAPSAVVLLSGNGDLWHQMRSFVFDLDQERVAAMLALDFAGVVR